MIPTDIFKIMLKGKLITIIVMATLCRSDSFSLIFLSKMRHLANKYSVNKIISIVTFSSVLTIANPLKSEAGMLTFPLPAPLKNNIVFVRSGESFADSRHEVQTNPVKKLRQDNALTFKGREQAVEAAKNIEKELDIIPTYIWASNTERAYETASIIAKECQLGQNRIVPEYSFLDARSIGIYEGKNDAESWEIIHNNDKEKGISYKPPPNTDGTPTDSVNDVLVRGNQLISTIESMYSGENVIVVSPDSDVLSILQAALTDENPDTTLPNHSKFQFKNGEVRKLVPFVKVSDLLYTGQTQDEADNVNRRMKALRIMGTSKATKQSPETWMDLFRISINSQS